MTDDEIPVLASAGVDGIARVTLNRPAVHNALNEVLIAAMTRVLQETRDNPGVRVVLLDGAGKSFCAGGDLNWMKRMAANAEAENVTDARALADMLSALDTLDKPVVGLLRGAVMGGGVGLASCCDVAVAASDTRFALPEVRHGLVAATIAPHVVAAIGPRQARRYLLTGERFDAAEAQRIGLVHEVVAPDGLQAAGERLAGEVLRGGPQALAASKALVASVAGRPIDDSVRDETSRLIARARAGKEGREGVTAFLEKRKPSWTGDGG